MARIIDGKAAAEQIQAELAREAAELAALGAPPGLAVVLVGDDPASHTYVRAKVRTAERLGIRARDYLLPAATPEEELLALVRRLNDDPEVHGILVQSPLPPPLRFDRVIEALDPRKDVDGLHPFNLGELVIGGTAMPPCTPAGIMELLRREGVPLSGAEAVVVGRSRLVGKPVAAMLLAENATVTICHSRTRDLPSVCRRADVLIVAIGRPGSVTAEYVREGAVVIDVGISRVDGRLLGDVDFPSVEPRASAITPVPGGVGPMTVTMLMRNTLIAARMAGRPREDRWRI